MAYQFKQFTVKDEHAAMKVGTDAVMLGAWVKVNNEKYVLDIGTGSGLIALMLAQRTSAYIDAIDIDPPSFEQAHQNFELSPWASRLNAIHASIQAYGKHPLRKYDLIVCNPPFFDNSLKSPDSGKSLSKHTDSLKFNELAHEISRLLLPKGKACIILPPGESIHFLNHALIEGLYCNRKTSVIPVAGKTANRLLLELSFERSGTTEGELIIRNKNHDYTKEYIHLTKDFYLNF